MTWKTFIRKQTENLSIVLYQPSNVLRSIRDTLNNNSSLFVKQAKLLSKISANNQEQNSSGKDKPNTKGFVDSFGREHTYLRVSVTEKCNFRCRYCMPAEGVQLTPAENLLTKDEISRLLNLFGSHGICKVRFTGGEPLVRKDFLEIVHSTQKIHNINNVGITTNGMLLHSQLLALKQAGIRGLNISLDTLVPSKFEFITRRRGHKTVLNSIFEAVEMGIPSVKVNCVVMRGFNEDEIPDFCKLARDWNITVRFIEYMPFEGNGWNLSKLVSFDEMKNKIMEEFGEFQMEENDIHDTTKHYRIPGFSGRIGFITSMSEHFCSGCNRLRLTADGNLRICLFGNKEVSLRDYMRQGATNEELSQVIRMAVKKKDFALGGYSHHWDISKHSPRPMVHIGG